MRDTTTPLLAARLRAERAARGWSLAVLAARAGLSKQAVSKIERGEASPTAATLGRLSGAFGLTLSALLARAEAPPPRLARRADQPIWRDPASGYLRRAVVAGAETPFELTEVALPPGKSVAYPRSAFLFVRQAIWSIEGELEFVEGTTIHRLGAGDSLMLGEPARCVFRNRGRRVCRYLVVVLRR